jgi:hypothetical protein
LTVRKTSEKEAAVRTTAKVRGCREKFSIMEAASLVCIKAGKSAAI